ncbi:MAG: hypothetical protein ACKOZT_09615 [Cyanobium sp.]
MLRLLLLGILLITLGYGLQRGWVEMHWDRMESDLGLPLRFGDVRDLFRSYSKPKQAL